MDSALTVTVHISWMNICCTHRWSLAPNFWLDYLKLWARNLHPMRHRVYERAHIHRRAIDEQSLN